MGALGWVFSYQRGKTSAEGGGVLLLGAAGGGEYRGLVVHRRGKVASAEASARVGKKGRCRAEGKGV